MLSMVETQPDIQDWAQNAVFLDVLQLHVLPAIMACEGSNTSIACIRATCRSWAKSSEAAPYQHIKVKLWGAGDMSSMAAFLRRHSRISSLDVRSVDPDVSTLVAGQCTASPQDSISSLLYALPPSLASVAFEGAAAVPLALLSCCARLPSLSQLSFRNLPDKWSFKPGMFPWNDVLVTEIVGSLSTTQLEAGPQLEGKREALRALLGPLRYGGALGMSGGPKLNRAMYGAAVWRRFQESWLQYEMGVAACLWAHGPHLQALMLESPARSLCTGITHSLLSCGNTVLCSLHLVGFGGKASSNVEYGEHEIGLDLTCLPQALALTSLRLVACGVAPTVAATFESLPRLQVLQLSRTSVVFTDRPPQLSGLQQLTELLLDHAEWLTADGGVWGAESNEVSEDHQVLGQQPFDMQQPSAAQPGDAPPSSSLAQLLPASLSVLNIQNFEGPHDLQLTAVTALSSLSVSMNKPSPQLQHSLRQWVAMGRHPPSPDDALLSGGSISNKDTAVTHSNPLLFLQYLSTYAAGLTMMRSLGLLSAGSVQLQHLELAGALPQQLESQDLLALLHLTSLTFKGKAEDGLNAESAQGPNSSSSSSSSGEDLLVFAPGPGSLPLLRELCLDVGCMGIVELDLRNLRSLTKLVVDSIEFVDLTKTSLPPTLVSITFHAWYGLPELFQLQESEENMPQRLEFLERKSERLFCKLLTQLPVLEMCHVSWDLLAFVQNLPNELRRTFLMPQVRDLRCQWKQELHAYELPELCRAFPLWEHMSISIGTRRQQYIRLPRRGDAVGERVYVMRKACGSECTLFDAAI